tara:strand:+ start:59 stop:352 length:294 start_codon:yes stop_codon:yes gene_type:complete
MFVLRNKAETSCWLHLFFSARIRHGRTMLTRSNRQAGEARLRYLDADVQVLAPGDFVVCAVTGRKIPLQALRYWSVDLQEAYWDAAAAGTRMVPAKG